MARAGHERDGRACRRNLPLGFEAMEERVLLTAAQGVATPAKGVAAMAQPTVALFSAPTPKLAPLAAKPAVSGQNLGGKLKFAVSTYKTSHNLAYSREVRTAGYNFVKLGVGHNTRKLGLAYLRAAIRGNGKTIQELNHSNLAKNIGDQFQNLAHSKNVHHVGTAFSRFGHGVANTFHRVFGVKTTKS